MCYRGTFLEETRFPGQRGGDAAGVDFAPMRNPHSSRMAQCNQPTPVEHAPAEETVPPLRPRRICLHAAVGPRSLGQDA